MNNKKELSAYDMFPFTLDDLEKMNAFDCLFESCKNHLDDVAITYKADPNVSNLNKKPFVTVITYRKLIENIINIYNSLLENGVRKGDIITYSSITTPELIYTFYASCMLGSIFKVMDPRFKKEDILKQFEKTPSKIFFCGDILSNEVVPICHDIKADKIVIMDFKESLPKIVQIGSKLIDRKNKGHIELEKDPIFTKWAKFYNKKSNPIMPKSSVSKSDVINISATTGTTGEPKQLMHTSENFNAQPYNAAHSGLQFIRGERMFNCTVPWVDFGLIIGVHMYLTNGITLDMDPTWTPETNAKHIIKNNPSWWMGAPGWLHDLFTNEEYKDAKLSKARYYITGGAPLFKEHHKLYQEKLDQMSEYGLIAPGYGCSETSAPVAQDISRKPGTLGKMWTLIDGKIFEPNTFKEVKTGEEGELCIADKDSRISQISPGYYNDPENTNKAFVYDENGTRWFRTGDKVVIDEEGVLTWKARYKNTLTYNGYNIDCDKITDFVGKIDGVEKVITFGCITFDGNQMPLISITLEDGFDEEVVKSIIKEKLADKFPDYYSPKDIIVWDDFPVISMKTDVQKMKHTVLDDDGYYKNDSKILKRNLTKE